MRASLQLACLTIVGICFAGPISGAKPAVPILSNSEESAGPPSMARASPVLPKLLNTNYPNGRTGFYVVTEGGAAYTWTGASGQKPDLDSQVLWLDVFISTKGDMTSNTKAEGSCTYKNPYQGQPSTLFCAAKYQGGEAQFRFEHDGSAPIES